MPIKKSSLKQKWYYRMAKTFFLILPLVFLILILLNEKVIVCNASPINLFDILKKNIVYIVTVLIAYLLIAMSIWKSFLHIAFGGVEDDTKNTGSTPTQAVDPGIQPVLEKPKPGKIARLIPVIIILALTAIYLLSEMGYITLPKIKSGFSGQGVEKAKPASGYTCPTTSKMAGQPCGEISKIPGAKGMDPKAAQTYSIFVLDSCECPRDTSFAQTTTGEDGKLYKICQCGGN